MGYIKNLADGIVMSDVYNRDGGFDDIGSDPGGSRTSGFLRVFADTVIAFFFLPGFAVASGIIFHDMGDPFVM